MTSLLLTFGWLLFIWAALLGTVSPLGLLSGAAVAAGLLWFFNPTPRTQDPPAFRPVYALAFIGYFVAKFIEANVKVAIAILQPSRVRHTRAVIGVPIVAASEASTMLLATTVTLTPGTFFLEIRRQPATLYVHILQLTSLRQARLSILEMERRIALAIGPAGAAEAVRQLQARVAAGEFDEGDRP